MAPYFILQRKITMKTLILTGAAGFIGLNVLKRLIKDAKTLKKYSSIISIDKLGYATTFNRIEYEKICKENSIDRIDVDINELPKLLYKVDTRKNIDIIDFASESHVDNSIKDPFSIYSQNASIPAKLLEWIGKDNWKNISTYWHISTDEIYSEIPLNEVYDPKTWFTTKSAFKPNNPYSASKAAQDCFLMAIRHTFGLNVKFIRMANQFGEYQHPEKFLPASVIRGLKGETIKVYGNGLNVRQWTPVKTTSQIIVEIINGDFAFSDVLHIANRFGIYKNNEIVNYIIDIMGEYGYNVKSEFVKDRLGHDSAYALDTGLRVDGYFEDFDIIKSIKETVKFYIDNKELYLKG
jgi:dTDP-glucose 4,6-dehydratase